MIIGSGPIVIGQGCEFDYSGVQACKVLRREGYRIVQRKRTWLGRVRFIAVRSREERELVLDPSSGEILRDYSTTISIASDGPSGRGEGRGGPGPREDTSDEPSDDDADDDDPQHQELLKR